MQTILIHLRLATASHRKRLLGIFGHFGPSGRWNLRLVPDEGELCSLVQGETPGGRPAGIISGVPYAPKTLELISRLGIPFVGIGMTGRELAAPPGAAAFVANDNTGIGAAGADYLLQLGDFRSFAFVPDVKSRPWSDLRRRGFADRLARNGKSCRVFKPGMGAGPDAGLSGFLASLPKPAAVLAAWDGRGADVLTTARRGGVRVPGEMAVLGVDDDTLICEHTFPMLSSVRTDAEGMGDAAGRLMSGLLSNPRKWSGATVDCPVLGVVERGSTHSPAPAADLIRRANAFISQKATDGIHADDVAAHLGVSRRLLDLRFRQFEPFSVSEAITRRRMDEARRLLGETDEPVKQVFRLAGFGNTANAHRLFKDETGLSPNAWRKGLRSAGAARRAPAAKGLAMEKASGLSPADLRDIRSLVSQLDPAANFDGGRLQAAIESGTTSLFAARHGGRIVGIAAGVRFSTPTGVHCRIEDVVVDQAFRSRHLGRKLVEFALDALRPCGASQVELTSRPARVAANALYRSLGFSPKETNVYTYRF